MLTQDSSTESTIFASNQSTYNIGLDNNPKQFNINFVQHVDPFIVNQSKPSISIPRSAKMSKHIPPKPRISKTVPSSRPEIVKKYAQIWGVLDRLELALRKVDTAKWEHDRLQDNLRFGPKDGSESSHQQRETVFFQRLERDLLNFGLSYEKTSHALASLKMHDTGTGLRAEVKHLVSKDDALIETLQSVGAAWEKDRVSMITKPLRFRFL